ncbi:MAG: phosphomannomutase/phosphoglucomutase [Clostridiales bacterium]|nr:phosphomannomutase/phosphoglucomutase [Clostridiales bacterium]
MDWMKLKSGSDVRGTAVGENAVLTPHVASCLGMAFARYIAEKKNKSIGQVTIALGRDSRISGPALLRAAAEGIAKAGANVLDFGMCTTPAMYMSIITPGFQPDASIMITASHHPYDKNGLKFFTEEGGIDGGVVKTLLEMACDLEPEGLSFSGSITEKAFLPTYKEQLADRIRKGLETDMAKPLLGLHVVVDAGNGAGGFYAELMEELGAWIEGSQFLEPDGYFPNHIPNPENAEAMASICAAVKKSGADLGVIFDTDCDRAAIVDSDGREINRNRLIALISAILLDEKPGQTIVTDSVTSAGLKKFINDWGGEHYRYKRGYRNVIDEAIRLNAEGIECPLAIETSGHAAMKENYFLDDGMYLVTVLIVRAMKLKQAGSTLGSLIADLQEPVESRELRLNITSEDFRETGKTAIQQVLDYANAADNWHIAPDNREGVRISFDLDGGMDNGWFLLRLSVHDPVLPLNAESDVPGGVKQMLTSLYEVLKNCEGINFEPLQKAIEA